MVFPKMGRKKKLLIRRNWDNTKVVLLNSQRFADNDDQPYNLTTNEPCLGGGSVFIDNSHSAINGEHSRLPELPEPEWAEKPTDHDIITENSLLGETQPQGDLVEDGHDEPDMAMARNTGGNDFPVEMPGKYIGDCAHIELLLHGNDDDDIVLPAFKRHDVIPPINKYELKLGEDQELDPEKQKHINKKVKHKKKADIVISKEEPPFTCFDAFINIISIGSYLADIASDIFVAFLYLNDSQWVFFGLTVVFILLPAIINTCFSVAWYVQDGKFYKKNGATVSFLRWVIRIIFLTLQLGPILRYIDATIYGCKSMRSKKSAESGRSKYYQDMMYNEDSDAAYLRLMECFIEAAPQLTLQLYIICKHGSHEMIIVKIGQSLACFTSLASLAWALTSYHRSLRFSIPEKANLGYIGMILQFVWRFFTVGSRVLAMALFASAYGYWIFVFVGCHWFIMFVWILTLRTTFCTTKCLEMLFNVVMAIVYIFCFVNITEGHTRLKYLLYYVVVYSENSALIMGWYIFAHTTTIWYLEPSLIMVFGGFFLGIFFQVIYYVFFHPNNTPPIDETKRIKLCVPCSVLCGCVRFEKNQHELCALDNINNPVRQLSKEEEDQIKHDKIIASLNNDGQKRIIEMSKHHQPHLHQTLV